ncbi:hypothetical protein LSH36_497g00040, partial [Paralvinella palmiformis]
MRTKKTSGRSAPNLKKKSKVIAPRSDDQKRIPEVILQSEPVLPPSGEDLMRPAASPAVSPTGQVVASSSE